MASQEVHDRRAPTFNMKAVARETGLKPDTLRAWERRYDLPRPQRTPGGHRVYSQRDIDILKWLIARQNEGLSISHAADLWRRLEAEGQNPLRAMPTPVTSEPLAMNLTVADGATMVQLRQAWVDACLEFDEPQAESVLAQSFALYPPEHVCTEVLQKGLATIGDRWYEGDITVQQEHFASELAMRRLEALMAAAPTPTRPGKILTACPTGEEHTFSALLLALLLRRKGWEVVYLGANVPTEHLVETLNRARPRLVILSAQHIQSAASLYDTARQVQEHRVMLAFGGRIFNQLPALRDRIPGHFLGSDLEQAVQAVEKLITSPLRLPEGQPPDNKSARALAHFRDHQAAIEAEVWESVRSLDISHDQAVTTKTNLADGIEATLALGDITFLGPEIDWIQGLMTNRGIPDHVLRAYLSAYSEAAHKNLDERGGPILDWLSQLSSDQR